MLTQYQRERRNKILRLLTETATALNQLHMRGRKSIELRDAGAIALRSSKELERVSRELRELAGDLGFSDET